MAQAIVLNNIDHHDLRLRTGRDAASDSLNQVLVFPTEFLELQREYAVFFRRDDDGRFQSVALLGLDKDENLFLSKDDGRIAWTARYIPALQERGPFSIGIDKGAPSPDDAVILVDLEHPLISRSEGEALFRSHGGNSPRLERVTRILQTIHQGVDVSNAMFDAFLAANLIAPLEVDLRLDDVTSYKLPDLFTISREALHDLDAATLQSLHRQGVLALAHYVLASHGNLAHLIELKNRRRARS